LEELNRGIQNEPAGEQPVCYGTYLSQHQYVPDVEKWGYMDARLQKTASPELASASL